MTYALKRRIVKLLDRPGGRRLLSAIATYFAQSMTDDSAIAVIYDGMWIDVVDGVFIPRSPTFGYYGYDFHSMRNSVRNAISASLDYWTYAYRPRIGDTVIDAGAGIGIDTLALSPLVGATGRIYSIEAHPWTFRALLKTCELNQLKNATPLRYALSDEPGVLWISDLPSNEENAVSKTASDGHAISVPAIDLDALVASQRIGRIDLLKMNIEGAEQMAISGISKCVNQISHISVACHDFRGDKFATREPVIAFLRDHGFCVTERRNDPRPYVRDHIHAVRK
jgi:FkbM family methyltransferase